MNSTRWQHYVPAFIAALFALIFMRLPVLAVIVVSGSLFLFATLYAFIVHKIHKMKHQGKFADAEVVTADVQTAEPNFKTVTIEINKFRKQFIDLD